jgi:hypothetical protein
MSQVRTLQVTGPASSAGTALSTQNPAEGASWAEVTGLVIPTGGAILDVNANGGAAIRFAVMPPSENPVIPVHNGDIIANAAFNQRHVPAGSRVWTKQL